MQMIRGHEHKVEEIRDLTGRIEPTPGSGVTSRLVSRGGFSRKRRGRLNGR